MTDSLKKPLIKLLEQQLTVPVEYRQRMENLVALIKSSPAGNIPNDVSGKQKIIRLLGLMFFKEMTGLDSPKNDKALQEFLADIKAETLQETKRFTSNKG